jgi:hypothetical protein
MKQDDDPDFPGYAMRIVARFIRFNVHSEKDHPQYPVYKPTTTLLLTIKSISASVFLSMVLRQGVR